jgi:hemerythrin-like domain-containing protein
MPVQIGAKAHDFHEPIGLLSDCHRRIEMFLRMLEAVAKSADRTPTEEARRALESALRYFREAAPKHTADEEESLFPRLRRISSVNLEAALSRMKELEKEHHWAELLHKDVDALGCTYLKQGKLSTDQVKLFRSNIADLAAMYQRHISAEDTELFPVAAQALSQADKLAIAREMGARRGVQQAKQGSAGA